jgi:hypothetical protein
LDFRTDALEALETPFEIDLFFTYMADGPEPDEVDPAFFRRILALAHRDAVEGVVVAYLSASDQTGWSAIIWALLAARSQFDRSQLIGLSRQLRITDPTFFDGLEKLVNRLVATRHLRQPGQTVSFSHPSVRAGFEIFIKENWARSEAAFASLISALTQLGGSQRDWALETAARSLKAIADLVAGAENLDAAFEADSASRARIDTWLEESLIDPRADFRPVLQLASDVGTLTSTPSELARWFIQGVRRGGQVFLKQWKPPNFDDAWYARVSADPRSFVIADRFVREQLPEDRDGFGDSFPNKLDRIATGLTPAFLAAARKLVASGFEMSARWQPARCETSSATKRCLRRRSMNLRAFTDPMNGRAKNNGARSRTVNVMRPSRKATYPSTRRTAMRLAFSWMPMCGKSDRLAAGGT